MSGDVDYSAYETDATENVSSEDLLAQITRACRELSEARADVTAAEEVLKAHQARVRQIEEFRLPELMKEAGQEKLRNADGEDVELKETLHASIPVANLPAALKWLIDHNQASIIKREMKLKFGKNEDDKAQRALEIILEAGFTPEDKQSVHPQTLAAVLRELLAAGVDVPMELLGAHVRNFVKVTPPKK